MTVGGVFCPHRHYESKGLYAPTQLTLVLFYIIYDYMLKIKTLLYSGPMRNYFMGGAGVSNKYLARLGAIFV